MQEVFGSSFSRLSHRQVATCWGSTWSAPHVAQRDLFRRRTVYVTTLISSNFRQDVVRGLMLIALLVAVGIAGRSHRHVFSLKSRKTAT